MQVLLQNIELTEKKCKELQRHLITAWDEYNILGLEQWKLQ